MSSSRYLEYPRLCASYTVVAQRFLVQIAFELAADMAPGLGASCVQHLNLVKVQSEFGILAATREPLYSEERTVL